jgi:predicted GNAT superfamily acetyltransferase
MSPDAVPAAPGVRVRDLHARAELSALADVLARVWPRPDGLPPLGLEALLAVAHAGGLVLGAFDRCGDGWLVGGAVGFVGLPLPGRRPRLHSHVVGVLPEVRGRSVGTALKWAQRRWCLDRGVTEVTWTFDPLVRRNTWLNVGKLGAVGTEYHEDFYGPMADGVNAGLPSDRCVATWELESARVVAAAAGRPDVPADAAALLAGGGRVVLAPDPSGRPQVHDVRPRTRLVLVPEDVHALRAADPDLALRWRLALRRVMGGALRDGLRLAAVTRDGWYVLAEGAGG